MSAAGLILSARALGVRLFIEGDRIKAMPPGKLPAELKAAIKADKPAVMRALADEAARAEAASNVPVACRECGSCSWTISLADADGSRTCYDCLSGRTALRRSGAAV